MHKKDAAYVDTLLAQELLERLGLPERLTTIRRVIHFIHSLEYDEEQRTLKNKPTGLFRHKRHKY